MNTQIDGIVYATGNGTQHTVGIVLELNGDALDEKKKIKKRK
jgi:hypothetical protein